MDIERFVQLVKYYCSKKNVKPTVACREAGVGQSFINNMESRGSIPSVEKVQQLARYLGVSTSELLGEHVTGPGDSIDQDLPYYDHLLLIGYHNADDRTREIVDQILEPFWEKERTSRSG